MEYLRAIRQTDFAKLWVAQIASQVAANLLNFALIIVVYDLTQQTRFASFAVSLLVLSFAIPSIFAAPLAGQYVDYWDRKKIMVAANALRAVLTILYLFAAHSFWLILLLTFVSATVTQFFLPAEAATIPKVVSPHNLLAANSMFVFSMYAAFMVGYSASGPVISWFGENGPFYTVIFLYVIATMLVTLIPKQKVGNEAAERPKLHLVRQLRHNWQVISEHPDRYFALMQLATIQGVVFVLITLAPALSQSLLHVPLQQASHVLIIPVGIGMVLGVLLVHSVVRQISKLRALQVSLVISAVALVFLGLTGQLYRDFHGNPLVPVAQVGFIVASIMLILGVMNAMISSLAQTLLQETTTDENRGKVFGSLQMMINLASTLPIIFTGILADLLSVTKVIVLIGVLLGAYGIYSITQYRKIQRRWA
ncbi:MAG TPA: MFS transporter [Candidatus Saccharimonadales bacterium]|nr:MFS transporter [Candidatus Saccharimonadales bacterium]